MWGSLRLAPNNILYRFFMEDGIEQQTDDGIDYLNDATVTGRVIVTYSSGGMSPSMLTHIARSDNMH